MAVIEERGQALRVSWRLGGTRGGARQSVTCHGTPKGRAKLASAAKELVEARNHDITRDECSRIIFGTDDADDSVPLLRDWIKTWLEGRAQRREIQADVIHSYRRILTSRAVPYLGHLRLTEIDPEVLRNWVGWLASSRITIGSKNRRIGDRLLSPTTIRRTHAILHSCLAAAVPKYLAVNPAARPAGASKHQSGLPKRSDFEGMFLTPDEINLILEHCDPHIRDLVEIAVRSGLRLGELIALESQYVIFDQRGNATILVRKALKNDETVGEPKSKASRRDVTLDRDGSKVMARRCGGKRPSQLVFASPRGKMWDEHNFRDRYWYPTIAAAMRCVEHPPPAPPRAKHGPTRRLRINEVSSCLCKTRLHRRPRFHDLRHTHASLLIADKTTNWPVTKIQARLGHASYQTTVNTYSHLLDLGNFEELAGLEERLAPTVCATAPIQADRRTAAVRLRARNARVQRRIGRRQRMVLRG